MNIEEKFKKIGKIFHNHDLSKKASLNTDLDTKVDDFIAWYTNSLNAEYSYLNCKASCYNYNEIEKRTLPIAMRNFIEKMAVWYELRYPNSYINESVDDNSLSDNCYDFDMFFKQLSILERKLFRMHQFPDLVVINGNNPFTYLHFHVSEDGVVSDIEKLNGKHISEAVKIFEDEGIYSSDLENMKRHIVMDKIETYRKEEMLNCVMYRIIERGGNRIGPRRAFLFAKEFDRDISIPMMYGMDVSDPDLKYFINEYLNAGGSRDLACYTNYFSRINKKDDIKFLTINKLLLDTEEETYASPSDKQFELLINGDPARKAESDAMLRQRRVKSKRKLK